MTVKKQVCPKFWGKPVFFFSNLLVNFLNIIKLCVLKLFD